MRLMEHVSRVMEAVYGALGQRLTCEWPPRQVN